MSKSTPSSPGWRGKSARQHSSKRAGRPSPYKTTLPSRKAPWHSTTRSAGSPTSSCKCRPSTFCVYTLRSQPRRCSHPQKRCVAVGAAPSHFMAFSQGNTSSVQARRCEFTKCRDNKCSGSRCTNGKRSPHCTRISSNRPPGERKSGTPAAVLTPAPVQMTTRRNSPAARRWKSSSSSSGRALEEPPARPPLSRSWCLRPRRCSARVAALCRSLPQVWQKWRSGGGPPAAGGSSPQRGQGSASR
mmetsp:Transcript_3/g.4  ORF Transcript_3/g.4 Transcript_3/m.4 type:complete len:244 (-) Transcript_3:9-740(-)